MQAARLLFLLVHHLLAACGWRPSRWGREVPAQPPSARRLPKSFQWRPGLGPSNGKQISLETPRCYRGAGGWMGNCILLRWPRAWAQFAPSAAGFWGRSPVPTRPLFPTSPCLYYRDTVGRPGLTPIAGITTSPRFFPPGPQPPPSFPAK